LGIDVRTLGSSPRSGLTRHSVRSRQFSVPRQLSRRPGVRDRVSETMSPRPCVRDRVSETVCPRPWVRDRVSETTCEGCKNSWRPPTGRVTLILHCSSCRSCVRDQVSETKKRYHVMYSTMEQSEGSEGGSAASVHRMVTPQHLRFLGHDEGRPSGHIPPLTC
jgi:hypothetical protein